MKFKRDIDRGRIVTEPMKNGSVIVFGDAHFWPGPTSCAYRALLKAITELRPRAVVANGDVFDGSAISRHARIGWEDNPSVMEELNVCLTRMEEIEELMGSQNLFWPLGNHDARFETFISNKTPEYGGVFGFHLKDHFPIWQPCWSMIVKGNIDTQITHRFKGGINAARNNVIFGGSHFVTGHTHRLGVTPVTMDGRTLFGVEHGMLSAVSGRTFTAYTESNPVDWRSGFIVLTWKDGDLLWPETCHVVNEAKGQVNWRGGVMEV